MSINRAFTLFFLIALLLSACDLLKGGTIPEPVETPTAAAATPEVGASAAPPQIPISSEPVTITESTVTLKVWIPPWIAERTEAGAITFAGQLSAFTADHPDVAIQVEEKQVGGPGGILSYLRTGRSIAPSVLPDLIAIQAENLAPAANESLIFSLEDQIDSQAINSLFPPAQSFTGVDGTILGYPFLLTGLPHLIYNSNVLTETLPLTWERLITDENRRLVFAADGDDGALLALQFYLDAGGQILNDLGQPSLQLETLEQALMQIEQARESGFIIAESANASSYNNSWQFFLSGDANIVRTSPEFFLQQPDTNLPLEYTVTPGFDRPLTPYVSGWVWAVSASDPGKREIAQELLNELISAPNLAAWSEAGQFLPSRRDALATWSVEGSYIGFVQQELERSEPLPVQGNSKVLTVLGDAVFEVVIGSKTAEEAAAEAVAALELQS